MRIAALCLMGLCLFACGGDDGGKDEDDSPGLTTDAGTGSRECLDEDGDGFGRYCSLGRDCDDDDAKITDECVRCAEPNKGCACEPGTKYMTCDPPDMATSKDGVQGTLVCSDGARYCRQGVWSDCEILLEYANFVPDSN